MSSLIGVVMCAVSFIFGFGHKKAHLRVPVRGGRCTGELRCVMTMDWRFRLRRFSSFTENSLLFVLHSNKLMCIIGI